MARSGASSSEELEDTFRGRPGSPWCSSPSGSRPASERSSRLVKAGPGLPRRSSLQCRVDAGACLAALRRRPLVGARHPLILRRKRTRMRSNARGTTTAAMPSWNGSSWGLLHRAFPCATESRPFLETELPRSTVAASLDPEPTGRVGRRSMAPPGTAYQTVPAGIETPIPRSSG